VSVLVVVGVLAVAWARIFFFRFVEDWVADYVFFARPVAEVEEAAAFAAERKVGACFGVGWLAADGAAVLHGFYSKANMNGFRWEFDPASRNRVKGAGGTPALRECSGAIWCAEAWIACAGIEGKAHDEDGVVVAT
jgi:hypothetical protein